MKKRRLTKKERARLNEDAAPIKRNRPAKYSKFPLSRHIKNSIDFLKKNRQEFTYKQIRDLAPIHLTQLRKVEELEGLLKNNSKISFNAATNMYKYSPKFSGIHSLGDIKELLKDETFRFSGIDSLELLDCYTGVQNDLDKFRLQIFPEGEEREKLIEILKKRKATRKKRRTKTKNKEEEEEEEEEDVFEEKFDQELSKQYFVVPNKKTKSDIFYYNPPEYRVPPIHPRIIEQYKTTMSNNVAFSNDLADIYIKNKMNESGIKYIKTVKWLSDEMDKKRKRDIEMDEQERERQNKKRKLRKVTNVHLLAEGQKVLEI